MESLCPRLVSLTNNSIGKVDGCHTVDSYIKEEKKEKDVAVVTCGPSAQYAPVTPETSYPLVSSTKEPLEDDSALFPSFN